jgi:uncharacterized protein
MKRDQVKSLEANWRNWAEEDSAIHAVAIVGSYAKGTAREDSDIDLMIICDVPEYYLSNVDWSTRFGKIQKAEREDWGLVQTWRVVYDPDMEVEYNFTTTQWCCDTELAQGTGRVISEGVRVVYDPERTIETVIEKIACLNLDFDKRQG